MEPADEKAKTEAADAFEKLGVCRQLAVAAADLGWKAPTSIQEQAVPHLLAGRPPHPRAAWQRVPCQAVQQSSLLFSCWLCCAHLPWQDSGSALSEAHSVLW